MTRTPSQTGRMSRRKGGQWERDVAHALSAIWPEACRGVGQARKGSTLADVEGTPYFLEAKAGKRPNIYAAIAQASEATDGRPVLVVARKNSVGGGAASVDTVTMLLDDWIALVKRAEETP